MVTTTSLGLATKFALLWRQVYRLINYRTCSPV